jgi:WD40 repeat protein
LPGSTVVMSVDYAPDDSALITAGQDGVTRVWPLPGPVMPGQTDTVFINPTDGSGTRVLAGVGSRGDGLRLWDVTDPDRPIVSERPLSPTTGDPLTGAAALSWDGSLAAGGTSSGAFQLWDVRAPQNPIPLGTPHAAVDSLVGVLVFTRTGDLLAVSPQNTPDVELWDVRDPSRPTRLSGFDVGNNPQVMAFSPDGRTLAVPTLNDEVELWNVSDPAAPVKVSTVAGFSGDAQATAFSPDGRMLAAGSADHTLRLWDVADPTTPRHVAQIVGPREAVYSVAFDPSGTRLVAGVDGQSMWMWDISDPFDPTTFATLTAYGNRVNDAVFTAGGAAVIGGGPEKDLRVWRTDPEDVVERICAGGGSTITREEWDQYLPGSPFRELC